MLIRGLKFFAFLLLLAAASGEPALDFAAAPHSYWDKEPHDRFSLLSAEVKAGRVRLDTSGELPLLRSLLKALAIPESSQIIVFSSASQQSRLISPRNPRAIYFNEDTSIGYIPGGRIEVSSLDPDLGAILSILDPLTPGVFPRADRQERCMNCHAEQYSHGLPGLVINSRVPNILGTTISAYRVNQSGHGIPFAERFGGYHVTGQHHIAQHWGDRIRTESLQGPKDTMIHLGELFDLRRYPASTSDILAQLVQEHQVGFTNRAIEATYLARSLGGKATAPQLGDIARPLVRYLLFADEAQIAAPGIEPDPAYRAAFLSTRCAAKNGASLKDLDLHTRMMKYRCSYMIYSPPFTGLPAPLKARVLRELADALRDGNTETAYLPADEKRAIRSILKDTLPGMPAAP